MKFKTCSEREIHSEGKSQGKETILNKFVARYLMYARNLASVRVTFDVIKHHYQKASWGGKSLFCLFFHTAIHHQGKSAQELTQGRKLQGRVDAEPMDGWYLLTCSAWLAYPVSL